MLRLLALFVRAEVRHRRRARGREPRPHARARPGARARRGSRCSAGGSSWSGATRGCRGRCWSRRWSRGSPSEGAQVTVAGRRAHAGGRLAGGRRGRRRRGDLGVAQPVRGQRREALRAGRPQAHRRRRDGARGRAARAARPRGAPAARTGDAVGTVVDGSNEREPLGRLGRASIEGRGLDGLSLVVDCANGAATVMAPKVLRALGATVEVLHDEPDGTNINAGCGSTYPEDLQKAVIQRGADAGLAFDGDADRVLAVDADGRLDRRRPDHRDHARSTGATTAGWPRTPSSPP